MEDEIREKAAPNVQINFNSRCLTDCAGPQGHEAEQIEEIAHENDRNPCSQMG
jgi:hypothetical protein